MIVTANPITKSQYPQREFTSAQAVSTMDRHSQPQRQIPGTHSENSPVVKAVSFMDCRHGQSNSCKIHGAGGRLGKTTPE
jgi:hypothetical protein